jgi:hypothetical protein
MQSIINEAFSKAFESIIISLIIIYSYSWSKIFVKKYTEEKKSNLSFKLSILYAIYGILVASIISFALYFLRIAGSKNERNDIIYSLTAFFILLIPYLWGILKWRNFEK